MMIIYLQNIESLDDIVQIEAAFPDIKKNNKYIEIKDKRLKGVI